MDAPTLDPDELACEAVLSGLVANAQSAQAAARKVVHLCASLTDDASPTLLDGLLRLARNETARRGALEALLLCGARSNGSWASVVRVRKVYAVEFGAVVADAYVAPRDWLRDKLDAIITKPTPAQVALESVTGERLLGVVKQLTKHDWDGIARSMLVRVVREVVELGGELNGLMLERAKTAFTENSPAAASVCNAVPSIKKERAENPEFARMLIAYGDPPPCSEQLHTPEQAFAYARVNRACVPQSAAAYVAFPHDVEFDSAFGREVLLQPRWLRGVVDEALDDALATVLAKVPSLRRMYSAKSGDDLVNLAGRYPWLVRRRVSDVCACLFVLLNGLSDDEERYETPCLDGMSTLLQTLAIIVKKTQSAGKEEKIIEVTLETVEFVLAEGRAQNGVPDMFGSIVHQLAAVLSLHKDDGKASEWVKKWRTVRDADGSSSVVRKAIDEFLQHVSDVCA